MTVGNNGFGSMNSPEHVAAARKIAQEGIVLLKNNGLLPLVPKDNMKILVVGENATRSLCEGGGSSELKPRDEVSPLRGIKERFGGKCTLRNGLAANVPLSMRKDMFPDARCMAK